MNQIALTTPKSGSFWRSQGCVLNFWDFGFGKYDLSPFQQKLPTDSVLHVDLTTTAMKLVIWILRDRVLDPCTISPNNVTNQKAWYPKKFCSSCIHWCHAQRFQSLCRLYHHCHEISISCIMQYRNPCTMSLNASNVLDLRAQYHKRFCSSCILSRYPS